MLTLLETVRDKISSTKLKTMTLEQPMRIPIVTWLTHEDMSDLGAQQACRGPGSSEPWKITHCQHSHL